MKKTLLILFLLPFLGLAQVIPAGDYIIANSNTADTFPNFQNLTTAVNYLNSHGIGGDVRFLLDNDQTVTSQITINAFTNANNNTVTIKPNTGKNIVINGNMPNSFTSVPAIFVFNGTKNVIIDGSNSTLNSKNLTLINGDNLSYTARSIIWVASNGATGSANITVKNSIFRFLSRNQQVILLTGVYSGSNQTGTDNVIDTNSSSVAANSNIIIANNEMINVKSGIYINGNSTSALSPTGWKIQGNLIGSTVDAEKPIRGIYISNSLSYEISGNTISGIRNTENQGNDTAAIVLLGNSSGAIFNNDINNIVNTVYNNSYSTSGILIKSTGATAIHNNIISNVYNTTPDSANGNFYNKGQGIFVTSGSTTNIYYNTIIMNGAPGGTAYSSCLYLTGGSNINIKNNILINSQANWQYALFNNGGGIISISNNDYYVTNSTNSFSNRNNSTEYVGTTGVTSWNTAVSDSNSQIILPTFVSATNFHLQNLTANNNLSGVAIPGFTTDVDGETRVKPYMGADEVVQCVANETPGNNIWKGYVYSYSGTPAATTYVGSVAEKPVFDRNIDAGTITGDTAVEANNFCGTAPNDKFFVRYLMNVTLAEAGNYSITVGADDGYRFYIDNVLVNALSNWGDHGYSSSFAKQTLTAGIHQFKIEYYENGGSARVSFSYGLPKGDPGLPYGDKVWNVYGFTKANLDLTNTELRDSYAGYYIDPAVNINSQTFWNKGQSPSVNNSAWNGIPIQIDNFTLTYKRKGFPCGRYQIQLVNCDDVAQVYLNGTLIFTQTYTTNGGIINNNAFYTLNKDSEIEVRLREDGGDANVAFNFIEVPFVYDGTTTPPSGSSITVNQNSNVTNNLDVCSCYISTGKTLTVPANVTLTVRENIDVKANGKLVIKNNGSLLQDTSGIYTGAATSFVMERTSSPMKNFDFTYWSSPVAGQILYNLSPNTLSDKYFSYTGTEYKQEVATTTAMVPGKGYLIRVPKPNSSYPNGKDNWTGSSYSQPVEFIGKPNNGDIIGETITTGNFYLIGNPYPSAIDAGALLFTNINNRNILNGTIYFWTHNTAIQQSGSQYIYKSNDYAAYNLTGGVAANSGGAAPSGNIAAGQSFFGSAKASGVIQFNNSMRVAGNNNQFFKPGKTAKTENLEKHRLWLDMTNDGGAFKQTLIGYIDGATNEYDGNFDGISFDGNSFIDFYSVNNTDNLTIQGRALPFKDTDEVPLGYRTAVAGDFTISVNNADGALANQTVYLIDKQTNTINDLTAKNYTFNTAIGKFNNRFVLKYTNKTLGTGDFEVADDAVSVVSVNKMITVSSTLDNIENIFIYDISGKLLYKKEKIEDLQISIQNLPFAHQILIVKVILQNGSTITKKVIFK